MCETIELELCCEAKPTNSAAYSIKVYTFVLPCAAIFSSNPDPTTTMLPPPASHVPISPPQPQPLALPPHPAPPHHHRHFADFNPASATSHHTRVFHTRCAECVRLRRPPRFAGGEFLLHAAQLTERLRRVQFERAVAAGPRGPGRPFSGRRRPSSASASAGPWRPMRSRGWAGETAFPHGIWGTSALEDVDMDDVGAFFVGRSRASCVSTPCSSGGTPYD
ncbi:hypothetical protein DL764_008013 [Monosporascus ibericus]|uniref:Uncharacterized protein n=1 Tax=Monosporascus ibericus TaxID=155417 RepID=A0A4Q4SYL5_9PEZI|nr:hypothetical protein DL764_008013 [Monosporascus ibericus]